MVLQRTVVCFVAVVLSATCSGAPGLGTISLPAFWQVKLDPEDVGVQEGWFAPSLGDEERKAWQSISTHKWLGWDKQGMPAHVGFAWYRVRGWLPRTSQKTFVYLYLSAVDEESWVWVNGQAAGEHTCASEKLGPNEMWQKPFFLDITKSARFGQPNQFTVRVGNKAAMGGVWQPVHVFTSDAPLTLAEMKKRADALNRDILEGVEEVVRYEVWTGYPYDPVFPDSVWQSGTEEGAPPDAASSAEASAGSWGRNRTGTVRVRGACGERVPLAVHVRNVSGALLPLRLDFQSVRHQERPGFTLSGDRVDVHLVDYVLTRTTDVVPDPLPHAAGGNNMVVPAKETGSFFVSIDTRGLPAGRWSGALRLTPLRSGPVLDVPFELEVAAAVLPERTPIWVNMWTYVPRWICRGSGRGGDGLYVELMHRTGVNTVLTRSYGMPWPRLGDRGELVGINTLDFDQMLARQAFDRARSFLVIGVLPESVKGSWGPDFLGEKWNRNFIEYLRMLATHVREDLGVPYSRWALYLQDEHIGANFVSLGELTREADPKIRIWANCVAELEVMRKAEPYIDIFVPVRWHIGQHPGSEELMRRKGKEWWMYAHSGWQAPDNTAVPRSDPYSAHRKLRMDGWLAWKHNLKGIGYWIYVGKWGGRYSGLGEHERADCSMVYLGHDGPITSRRLEAYREGLEDYKLLWIIDRAAGADGQEPGLVREARVHVEAAVEEVLAKPRTGEKLLRWRSTLLDDAGKLCAAAPLDVEIGEVSTTRNSATLRLAASKPIRAWVWHRGEGVRPPIEERNWRLVESSLEASTSLTLTIGGLVPAQRSEVTLVVAGPEGQQELLVQDFTTRGW